MIAWTEACLLFADGRERGSDMPARKTKRLALSQPQASPARSAWSQHDHLLGLATEEPLQARFIEHARSHSHEAYREPEMALDLRVGVRHLARLVKRWFGYSPRIVVGLLRVESVARGLRTSRGVMKELAAEHGYPSRQAMNRHFRAYTGVSPAAYKHLMTKTVRSENDPQKSENEPPRK